MRLSTIALACVLSTISLLASEEASAQIGSEYDSVDSITLSCTYTSKADGTKTEEHTINLKNRTWDSDADGDRDSGDGWRSTIRVNISNAVFSKQYLTDRYLRSGTQNDADITTINRATGEFSFNMYSDGKPDKKYAETGHCTVKSVKGQVGSPAQVTAATQQQAADEIAQQQADQNRIRSAYRAQTFNKVMGALADPNNDPNNSPIAQANAQQQANLQQTAVLLQQQREREAQQQAQQSQQQAQQRQQQAMAQAVQQVSSPAQPDNGGTQTPTDSCRNMTSCLRIYATYTGEGSDGYEHVLVTNTCNQTVNVTVSLYAQGRSCTTGQNTNLKPGEMQEMGDLTPRNWYSAQADDSISWGKTGKGCKVVVPTDCNQQ